MHFTYSNTLLKKKNWSLTKYSEKSLEEREEIKREKKIGTT